MRNAAIFAGGTVLLVAVLFGAGGSQSIVETATDVVAAGAERQDETAPSDGERTSARQTPAEEPTFTDDADLGFGGQASPDEAVGDPALPEERSRAVASTTARRPTPPIDGQSATRPRNTQPRRTGNTERELAEDIQAALNRD